MEARPAKKKSVKRMESKKRKVQAFLELANAEKEEDETPTKQPCLDDSSLAGDNRPGDNSDVIMDLAELRAKLTAERKIRMQKPKVYLTLDDLQIPNQPSPSFVMCQPAVSTEPRYMPLFAMDLQHLLLYAIQGNIASYKPRWCKLLRWSKISHVIVLILNEVSNTEFKNFPECFQFINSAFQMKTEMISPSDYGSTVLQELLNVPISRREVRNHVKDRRWKAFKSEKKEFKNLISVEVDQTEVIKPETKDVQKEHQDSKGKAVSRNDEEQDDSEEKVQKQDDNKKEVSKDEADDNSQREFSRLDLLLSPLQLVQENYPLPINVEKFPGYTYSHPHYTTVKKESPLYALDCEMCMTKKNVLEVTRVAIVDENLQTVYDTLVKPYNRIINYLTRYSGITKEMLQNVTTRLENVHHMIQKILPSDAILCGQSLNSDLHALKLYHPYVIDTSVIYNLAGERRIKPGLKRLAAHFLGKDIQQSPDGHSPVEDAFTTMELVQLKLKNGIHFGDVALGGVAAFQTSEDKPTDSEKEYLAVQSTSSIRKNDAKAVTKDEEEMDTRSRVISCEGCKNCQKNQVKNPEDSSDSESSYCEKDNILSCDKCQSKEKKTEPSEAECSKGSKEETSAVNKPRNKKKVFFERPGTRLNRHMFDLTEQSKRSVTIVGQCPEFEEAAQKFPETSEASELDHVVRHIATTSDKSTAKKCKKSLCGSFLNMAVFNEFNAYCSDEDKRESLKKLDKRVKKVLKDAPSDSLVAVMLGGHSDPVQSHQALCFVKCIF